MELPGARLAQKIRNIQPGKKFLIFREIELSRSNIKKFLNFSYVLGNGTFRPKLKKIYAKKIPYISKNRTFLL